MIEASIHSNFDTDDAALRRTRNLRVGLALVGAMLALFGFAVTYIALYQ